MRRAIKAKYVMSFHSPGPTVIKDGIIIVENNKIIDVGADLSTDGMELDEFSNHILMPGMVNTHSHVAMTLFRGYADDIPLHSWLNDYIWPMEAKLKPDHIEIGAKMAALEAIRLGTTTINSMYWQPDREASGFKEIGVRLMTGPPIISGITGVEDQGTLISDWHGKNGDMTRIAINPHTPYTVTDEDFKAAHHYKEEYNSKNDGAPLKLHTHLDESGSEMNMIRSFAKDKGFEISADVRTPTQYLDSLNVLDGDMIASHCVECSDEDLDLLRSKNVGISTNTVANMKLGHGTPTIDTSMQKYNKVSIGTDGPSSNNILDMFESMKFTSLLQKTRSRQASALPAANVLRMATFGGANVLGWEGIGKIEKDAYADLILVDMDKPHLKPVLNSDSIISHLVYSVRGTDVSDVMINGEWKLKDTEYVNQNIESIYSSFDDAVNELFNS